MAYVGASSIPGTNYQQLNNGPGFGDITRTVTLYDEFSGEFGGGGGDGQIPWKLTNGWTSITPSNANQIGVVQFQVANGDRTECFLSANTATYCFLTGGGQMDIYWKFQLTALSISTDRYELSIGCDQGILNNWSASFYYTDNVNSGKWQLNTQNNGTGTPINTNVTVDTNWHTAHININAAGTILTYFLDGVQLGQVTSNIPTQLTPGVNIQKDTGTTGVGVNVDYFLMHYEMTTPR